MNWLKSKICYFIFLYYFLRIPKELIHKTTVYYNFKKFIINIAKFIKLFCIQFKLNKIVYIIKIKYNQIINLL